MLRMGVFLLAPFSSEEGIFKELLQMFLCQKSSQATCPRISSSAALSSVLSGSPQGYGLLEGRTCHFQNCYLQDVHV